MPSLNLMVNDDLIIWEYQIGHVIICLIGIVLPIYYSVHEVNYLKHIHNKANCIISVISCT